eukprot:m.47328 g.47328  ORF g.47328 m.47328 type:complete len:426 (-) comp10482_c0_seq1:1100-2377(-)
MPETPPTPASPGTPQSPRRRPMSPETPLSSRRSRSRTPSSSPSASSSSSRQRTPSRQRSHDDYRERGRRHYRSRRRFRSLSRDRYHSRRDSNNERASQTPVTPPPAEHTTIATRNHNSSDRYQHRDEYLSTETYCDLPPRATPSLKQAVVSTVQDGGATGFMNLQKRAIASLKEKGVLDRVEDSVKTAVKTNLDKLENELAGSTSQRQLDIIMNKLFDSEIYRNLRKDINDVFRRDNKLDDALKDSVKAAVGIERSKHEKKNAIVGKAEASKDESQKANPKKPVKKESLVAKLEKFAKLNSANGKKANTRKSLSQVQTNGMDSNIKVSVDKTSDSKSPSHESKLEPNKRSHSETQPATKSTEAKNNDTLQDSDSDVSSVSSIHTSDLSDFSSDDMEKEKKKKPTLKRKKGTANKKNPKRRKSKNS